MPSQPQASTPPSQQPPPHAVIAALTTVLLAGLPAATAAGYIATILAPLGISAEIVDELLPLVFPHVRPPEFGRTGAEGFHARTTAPRTAAYILSAAQRLRDGGNIQAERTYLSQHLDAQRTRREVTRRVDVASRLWGPELGWYAIRDARTTPACRQAHGSNFHVDRPPAIGYPGTLHGGTCRCLPGPPHADGKFVDDVVSSPA